jgi:hydroxymethylpyrimidine pyrophosphatase-like HAD family hydrolase
LQTLEQYYDELTSTRSLHTFLTDAGMVIQIMAQSASKLAGMREILASRGIEDDEVAVFGDDTPDMDMLRYFPNSCAMMNASSQVKACAAHVTASHDEDGIYYALRDQLGIV